MATAVKLAVIGAGSATFSLPLVRDICLTPDLDGSEIAFMDVDQGRLDMVYELARRYAAEMGANLRFSKSLDREATLREADFVLNTAMVGGHDQQESDRELMEQYGYYRGVRLADEYRQFDLMLSVARDIERLCPDAWLIQSSNPVFEGCTLMSRETDVKLIGLCHGHYGYKEIVDVLGLDPAQVTYEIPGFNHCIWMTHFRYQGQDAYPLIDEWIENESERYWQSWTPAFHQTQMSPAAVQMYHLYGLMPIGDTSRALWEDAWWYHLDEETKRRWWGPLGGFDSAAGWAIYLESLNRRIAQIREVASDAKRRVSEVFPPEHSGEQIVPIIDSLTNDKAGSYQVNVPNDGALRAIPDNVVVEVPAIIDGKGVRPLAVGWLPETVMLGVIWPRWLQMERALAAYLTGDPGYLMQRLLADHRTKTLEQAEEALEALLHSPGNQRMARRYRQ